MEEQYMSTIMILATFMLVIFWFVKANTKVEVGVEPWPPGPLGLPIIGNLLELRGRMPYRTLASLAARYGPIIHLKLGFFQSIVVSNLALAHEVLHTNDKLLTSRPPLESLQRLFYGTRQLAVFNSPCTACWHRTKKYYNIHLFSEHRIYSMCQPIIVDEVRHMIDQIGQTKAGMPLDLSSRIRSLVENIISRILFGQPLTDSLLHSAKPIFTADNGSVSFRNILHQFVILFQSGVIGDFIPLLGFLDYPIKRTMDTWHSLFENLLESVIQHIESSDDPLPPNAFVIELLSNKDFSRDKVKAILMELLAAGIDTSSVTLDWAMAELLSNKYILRKLKQEINHVVGEERLVTTTDLPNLPYCKAVIKETFRRHMPAPLLLPRISTKSCKLGGYHIPQGTRVFVNAWAIANDPQVWTKPDEFIPERFCDMNFNETKFDLYKSHILSFGMGRRACPGKPLGLLIIELTLSNLVHRFDWTLSSGSHTVDMSEKFGAVASRTQPIIAIPTLKIPHSILLD